MAKISKEEVEEDRQWLLTILGDGDSRTVFTTLRHVSRSGLLRVISLHVATGQDEVIGIGGRASTVLGWRYDARRGGVRVDGTGMDMGFHLVYSLSQVLYRDGYRLSHRWL